MFEFLAGFLRPGGRGDHLSDWIDWLASNPSKDVVFTTTGGLMRVVALDLPDLESESNYSLVTHYDDITRTMCMPGTGWSTWWDMWRRLDKGYLPDSDFGGCEAARRVDDSRRAQFVGRDVYLNRSYLAMHYTPQSRDALISFLHERDATSAKETMQAFMGHSDEILRALDRVCPSLRVLEGDAFGTYLVETETYRHERTPLPPVLKGTLDTLADWHPGTIGVKVDGLHVVAVEAHTFGGPSPRQLEILHELPFELRWTTTLHHLDPNDQRAWLKWLRNLWTPKQYDFLSWIMVAVTRNRSYGTIRPDVATIMAEIDELEARLQEERDGLAIATMTVRTWDKDLGVALDRAQTIQGHMRGAGLAARIATMNAGPGTLADIPGNASKDLVNRRQPRIRLSTVARSAPVTGLSSGPLADYHLNGPPLLVAHSRRRTPLFFALHPPGSDVGHFAVIGRTGGGKSALLSTIAMQFKRYPGSSVTIFDMRRSAMVATLCSDDSHWVELGGGGIGVQPLRNIHDPAEMAWAATWLGEALKMRSVTPSAAVDQALTEALKAVARELPPNERTLTALCAYLGAHSGVRNALHHYTSSGGPLGSVMDGVVESYGNARMLTIEIARVMDMAEASLILAACFRQIERERLTGSHPKLVLVDEAGLALDHPLFLKQIENLARTMRKLNGSLGLFSQSLMDLKGKALTVIGQQLEQMIFTSDDQALHPDNAELYRGVGLGEEQIKLLPTLMSKGEYLFKTPHLTRVGEVKLEHEARAICGASKPEDILRAQALLAAGVKPGREFLHHWLGEKT